MRTIDVVWLNKNPEAIARGYWDQALLEAALNGTLWRSPRQFEFRHVESVDDVEGSGALVIIPAQHNHTRVDAINFDLERLEWCTVILSGDEEHLFPWRELQHPNMSVWVQTPDPDEHADADFTFGEPFTPQTRPTLAAIGEVSKTNDWFFSGQVTHERRDQCVFALNSRPRGILNKTAGFTQGFSAPDYFTNLAMAKVAPCPSGPHTPDTFRVFEALEAGCVPIVDATTPHGNSWGYWDLVCDGHPFPEVAVWNDVHEHIDRIVRTWPVEANRCGCWYLKYLRNFNNHLHDEVNVDYQSPTDAKDLITVIITSSPIPSHPSTRCIEEVVESVRSRLDDVEIIIALDGVREEQEDKRQDYEEYIANLLTLCRRKWSNVLPIRLPVHVHQANATKEALNFVRTPYILFMEHDTQLLGDIPFDAIVKMMEKNDDVDVLRLHSEVEVLEPHKHMMLDETARYIDNIPMLRTAQWSQRPHIARTNWYRHMLWVYFGSASRTMIEDSIHGVLWEQYKLHGDDGWRQFRLWMYAPPDGFKRSGHLDGRAGDTKFDMIYEYDTDDIPASAPYPTSKREA